MSFFNARSSSAQVHGSSARRPLSAAGKAAAIPPLILGVVFIIALVLAANNGNVLSWFLAVVALGWLLLSTFVYIGVVKAASFGAEQVRRAQEVIGGQPSPNAATVVEDGVVSDGVRDTKLEHSFKIIEVQVGVLREKLAAVHASEPVSGELAQAMDTIEMTASNGKDMLRGPRAESAREQQRQRQQTRSQQGNEARDRRDSGPEETITGVVID